MKRIKMLGLAVMAALVLAGLAAGSSPATVFCKNATKPCTERYPKETELHLRLEEGTSLVKKTDDESKTIDSCNMSTIKMTTSNEGSETETVSATVNETTLGNCKSPNAVLVKGSMEFHYDEKTGNTVVTGKSTTITEKIFTFGGLIIDHCWYGYGSGTNLGTLTQPANAFSDTLFHMKATIKFIEGSEECPASTVWQATYTVTSPIPLYVANS